MEENRTPTKASRKSKRNITEDQKTLFHSFYEFLTNLKKDIELDLTKSQMLEKYGNVCFTCSEVCQMATSTVSKIIRAKKINVECINATLIPKIAYRKTKYKCDKIIISQIRKVVLDLYVQKVYPSLENILNQCLQITDFPTISRSTLHRWMLKYCNFRFKAVGKKPVFLERNDIKAQRKYYLKSIKKYREEGYKIVYTDETWTSPDMAPSRCWQLLLKGEELKEFSNYTTNKVLQTISGYTGGFMVKGGQGRIIINHAGGDMGFIKGEGVCDIFISKKDSSDYHSSMNALHFIDWFTKLVSSVEDKTVVVLDQAPYHKSRVRSTIMPKKYKKKQEIIDSLVLRKIVPPEENSYAKMTKDQLINWSEKHPVAPKYEIELIAEQSGKDIKILWLPVAHCELNPIELIWSIVKRDVANHNSIGGTKNVYELSKKAVEAVTREKWQNCVKHAIQIEDDMIKRDLDIEGVSELQDSDIDSDVDAELDFEFEFNSDCESDVSVEL